MNSYNKPKTYLPGTEPKKQEPKPDPQEEANPSGVIVKTRNKERGNAALGSLKDLLK